ncbi:Tetratricopeptide repeat protein 8 [Diplonema papillatum]|nr:Tetratricopeptide repeat protein 8 [Diplonema papillatum]
MAGAPGETETNKAPPLPPNKLDKAVYALSLMRRRKFDEAIDKCSELLEVNDRDKQVWYMKARSLTQKNWIDDTEVEDEGVAELLLDENAISNMPRPGTSFERPNTGASSGSQAVRPSSGLGRPASGFVRPGTQSRPGSKSGSVEAAFQGARPGSARPITAAGRFVRLGTASMRQETGRPFMNAERMDMKRKATRPTEAKVICDFLLYHDHNPMKALELASEATKAAEYNDWWWKARLGKCFHQLGLYRDAEKQFKSSLKTQEMISTYLELGKVFHKLDQPLTALELFEKGIERHPQDTHLLLACARIHEQLNNMEKGVAYYKQVLALDSSNSEAIACLATNHFYEDQPEIALRLYRRLLQMGVTNTELWNNLGLCCFYASQYDMTLSCFERALALASDENMADIWYNIGQVAIGIGDLGLAYQAFKVAISVDPNHAESFNNLGILELRKQNVDQARSNFQTASRLNPHIHEPLFNGGLLAFKLGDFQEAYTLTMKSLEQFPEHTESLELCKQLRQHFTAI